MRGTVATLVLIASCLAAACGSPNPPSSPDGAPSAAPPADAPPADAPPADAPPAASSAEPQAKPAAGGTWKDAKSKEEKAAFMKEHVSPTMAKVFQAGDAKRYASFDCKTCHGPKFQDPDEFLPKLKMKDGKLTAFAEKPEVSKFMAEKVVPEMAKLMGEQPYDPATHQGFGCGGCHTVEGK